MMLVFGRRIRLLMAVMNAMIMIIAAMVLMTTATSSVYAGADSASGLEVHPLQYINGDLDQTGECSLKLVCVKGNMGDTVFVSILKRDQTIDRNLPFTVDQASENGATGCCYVTIERSAENLINDCGAGLEILIYASRTNDDLIWSGHVYPVFANLEGVDDPVAIGAYAEGASVIPDEYIQRAGVKYHLSSNDPTGEDALTYSYEVFHEEPIDGPPKGVSPLARMKSSGKTTLVLTWSKTQGAQGYDIYFAKTGRKMKKAATVTADRKRRWTKKKLKKSIAYKARVKAWSMKDGVKTYIRTSPTVYAYTNKGTKKYTNPKGVTVNKTKVSLKPGKTFRLKAKVTRLDKSRKLKAFARNPRYQSSDPAIATVSKTGTIKARARGTCRIYVYATNGVMKTVKVIV